MPAATPNLDIPYMLDTDPMADVAEIMQALAERLDNAAGVIRGTASVTFSSGVGSFTHNAGFVPAGVLVQARLGASLVHVAPNSTGWTTTAGSIRAWTSAGAGYTGGLSAIAWTIWP